MLDLDEDKLDVRFVKGKWFDAGTFESWFEANAYMRQLVLRQQKEQTNNTSIEQVGTSEPPKGERYLQHGEQYSKIDKPIEYTSFSPGLLSTKYQESLAES